MVDLRKNERLFILIAGILMIITIWIPMSIVSFSTGDLRIYWMFGIFLDWDSFAFDSLYTLRLGFIIGGSFFALILLSLGIFLIILANFIKKGKSIRFQEYLLLSIGLFALVMPYLFRSLMSLVSIILSSENIFAFSGFFYSIELIMPISAILLLIPGGLKISE
ncbi:MAG: hypothetical protein R6W84_09425 [Promethearchaeia archaeon]